MALSAINVGGSPNDGTGDSLRTAFVKVNTNFDLVSGANNGALSASDLAITSPTAPLSSNSTGSTGQISWDVNYIYICTSTDTWARSPLSGW